MILSLLGSFGIVGFIIWIVYTFRSDGARVEKLKNSEAINDQNDELLAFIKRKEEFERRLRDDHEFAEFVRNQLNDNKK